VERINSVNDDEVTQCQHVLGEQGRLTTAIPGFKARSQQIDLASAIAKTIQQNGILVAEAGTGTGKTYAYLIPCLLSGKKTLISTATKTLQDQLFNKDLPMLVRALGLSVRMQNLKGRSNYLCQYRIDLHAKEGRFISPQCAHEILQVQKKLPRLNDGERNELPEIAEDSPVWPYVTSTSDNCLGAECEFQQSCFLIKARKRALQANVVVINHHLFFADSRLKEEGFGELLPNAEIVVFDEAHQLAGIATDFQGERLSTRQFRDLMDDILREWPVLDLVNQPLKQLSLQLDQKLDQVMMSIHLPEGRLSWDEIKNNKSFHESCKALEAFSKELLLCFAGPSLEVPGIERCRERLQELIRSLEIFKNQDSAFIRWIERFKNSLVLHSTPIDIAEAFQSLISKQNCSHIFTSATLTMASSFAHFIKPLGLNQVETLLLPSPFDFQKQALMYLPRGLPDPQHNDYHETLLKKVMPVIEACGGRCFFLFTSHRALQRVASMLSAKFKFPLLIQGEEAKPILLARFRQLGNAVLLGTSTFWEGVDVKGEALSCVIIDKLPFASPNDPVTRGRMSSYKAQGLSGFDELSLPNAVLALKQGVGRLIRDASDKGVLMIADPRLTARDYGKRIFASLPAMRKTRSEETVLAFIHQLALTHEPISD
jgi:ATP-dependent DNA helicase DinG